MNDLLVSMLVLISSTDGKLMETTAKETAWYLLKSQQYMLDRTDEGMLASYWMVAGHYAYRYAYPQNYMESSVFYDGPASGRIQAAERPEEVKVLTPQ